MKKLLALAIAAIGLTACGETKTIVIQQPATTIPVTTISHYGDEENYLNGVANDFPSEVSRLGKVKVVEIGHLACQSIDEGATISDFVQIANSIGSDGGFIGSIIREAVENFCPENQWFIDSALNA